MSIAQIAERLGRAPATIKAYFYDPTGEKARAVKARYLGVCRGCGAPTTARSGKGDAYQFCKNCHPGRSCRPARDWVRDAMHEWHSDMAGHHRRPTGLGLTPADAAARHSSDSKLETSLVPSTVIDIYGSWPAADADALADN